MIDIKTVEVGEFVVVTEMKAGEQRFFLGAVSLVDNERGEIGIRRVLRTKIGEEIQAFTSKQVWRLNDLIDNMRGQRGQDSFSYKPHRENGHVTQLLAGFIMAVANGKVNEPTLKEVAQELIDKGLAKSETKAQEIIGALYGK